MEMDQVNISSDINLILLYCPVRNGYYGMGTHMDNLLSFLKHQHGIIPAIVITDDEKSREIYSINKNGIRIIHIPAPEHKVHLTSDANLLQKRYAQRITELLDLFLTDKRKLVFLINSVDYLNVCISIKQTFEYAKIIYIHHGWSWKYFHNISDKDFSDRWKKGEALDKIAFELTSFQQKMAQISDIIITVTEQAKSFFVHTLDIPIEKIETIYNGISAPELNTVGKKNLRFKYGFSETDRIIIFSGRIQKEKGVHYLLKAFTFLAHQRQNVRLIIVGDGDFDELVPLANPFWSKITFTGMIEPKTLSELYYLSDIGVLPSMFEQCSYTTIEMRFHNLPIIVSSVDGLDEMFEDQIDALKLKVYEDKNGYRVLNEIDIFQCFEKLLDDPELRNTLTKNSFSKSSKYFTSNEMYKKYFQILKSLNFEHQK